MPYNGYFKVWRRLIDSEFWLSEKFTRPQAWVDLIGLANHKPKSFRVRGILVKVERGQVARSILGLSERWKWSRKKVMRVLEEWKQDNKVHTKSDNITTLITIINYDEWQGDVTPNDTPKVTPEAHQTHTKRHTNNNEKNEKNVKNKRFMPPTPEQVDEYCKTRNNGISGKVFVDYYQARGWKYKGGIPMKDWKAGVRTWEEKNKEDKKKEFHGVNLGPNMFGDTE